MLRTAFPFLRFFRTRGAAAFGLAIFFAPLPGATFGDIQSLIVIGDSYSDTGRLNGTVFTDPETSRLWIDELASRLDLPAPVPYHPSTAPEGRNFAFSGSPARAALQQFSDGPRQLDELFNGVLAGAPVPADALVVVWIGINDLVTLGDDPTAAADATALLLVRLAERGARQFLVGEMFPLGRAPDFNDAPATNNALARTFNTRLRSHLHALQARFPAVQFASFDTYALFEAIVARPGTYGFENVEDAAFLASGQPYATWLWYDLNHPTSAGHAAIGTFAWDCLVAAREGRRAAGVRTEMEWSGGGWSLRLEGPALPSLTVEASVDGAAWEPVARFTPFPESGSIGFDPGANALYLLRAR